MTMPDERIATPVPVEIKNWAEPVKPPYVKNTTLKTYIIDPASAIGQKNVQISDFEPRRLRLMIQVIDSGVALLTDPPTTSPDVSSTANANAGLYLSPNDSGNTYEFFGPDAFWLNALTTITRVTVTKEYC